MGWHNVQKFLEQSAEHSTLIGRFWVTSFFLLRMLIATAMAGSVWGDAQGAFTCNTLSPGCKNVCFNEYSPIAVTRYWLLQMLFVSLPSIIFIIYTAHKLAKVDVVVAARRRKLNEERAERKRIREQKRERVKQRMIEAGEDPSTLKDNDTAAEEEDQDKKDNDKLVATKLSEDAPSKLFIAYFMVVVARLLLEIGFMVGQYYLYTFKFLMPELFQCQHWPCPNVVECWVSRPKEKSIFICVFYATGCIMVILNIIELFHIAEKFPKAWRERHDDITKHADEGPSFGHKTSRLWAPGTHYIEDLTTGYPDATGLPMIYERPPRITHHKGRGHRSRR